MLKFQENCTIENQSFEDFILLIFVLTDDFYKSVAPDSVKFRSNIEKALLSDSEIITIAICGELIGIDSEKAWLNFVKRNLRHLFPKMCDRTRFNRTRRNLLQVMNLIFAEIASYLKDKFLIADSFPLEVCKFGRAHFCKAFKFEGAKYGYCASKKQTYFGYKLHALTTVDGAVMIFEITPANVDDRKGLRDMTSDFTDFYSVFGDKGYFDKNLEQEFKSRGQFLFALKRDNAKNNLSDEERKFILKYRKRIETVFSQLTDQFNIERVLAKTFRGLSVRLLTKFLAFNLCLFINKIFYFNFSTVKSLTF